MGFGEIASLGLNLGMKFMLKFAVSKSTLWALGLTVFLKLFDLFLEWRSNDKKMKEAYIKFIGEMQKRQLIGAKFKKSAQDQIDELNRMSDEESKANPVQ